MPPCCDLPVKLTEQSKQERKGLNLCQPYFLLMAVLGVETGNKISFGCGFWILIYWGGPLQFEKLEGVVQSTRRVPTLEPLLVWKVACLC